LAGAEYQSDGRPASDIATALEGLRVQADPAMLRERYARELATLELEVERLEKKLANEKFVANAKPGVVDGERAKLDGYRRQREAVTLASRALD